VVKTTWPVKTLGDVCELQRGHDLPTPKRREGKVPILGSTGITGFHDVALYDGPGVAIGRSGFIGGAQYCDTPYWPLNTCLFIKDFFGNEPRWVYYFLKSIDFSQYNSGATQPSLNRNNLINIPVVAPPLEEQKRIVELLDAATARVTELTLCYEQARALANNLFTCALRDAFESNPDWPVKTLGELGVVKGGKRLPKGTPWSATATSHPYIRATDIRDGKIRTEGLVYVPDRIWPAISRYIVEEGDVLITIAGTIGSIAEVSRELSGANLTENAAKITSLQGLIPAYLSYFLRSPDVREKLENLATTTTQAKLALFRIETIQLSVPPLGAQRQIVARLELMKEKTSEMVAAYDAKLTAAKDLRQSILEAAFAGDL
jgi:type I restriction enzyme S subunit